MSTENQKLKLLYLQRMFYEQTDEEHGLTMPQIIEGLEELGITAERKAIYRDIKALQEFGLEIHKLKTSPVEYALVKRQFSLAEMLLLVDAVQSSRFLTKRKSDDLVRSIRNLASKNQSKNLSKRLHVQGRIKMQNESIFYNVDMIQQAISKKRKVEFRYFRYDESKNRAFSHDGEAYVETPVQLMYSDGCYYLIAFNDKHNSLVTYRVDRMVDICVSSETAVKNQIIADFDVNDYEARAFGMFSGDPTTAVLLVKAEAMGAVIDRFGKDVQAASNNDGTATVTVSVMESPTFYGWLAQFGDQIIVQKPSALRRGYIEFLDKIKDAYN